MREYFDRMDSDSSGFLDQEELAAWVRPEGFVQVQQIDRSRVQKETFSVLDHFAQGTEGQLQKRTPSLSSLPFSAFPFLNSGQDGSHLHNERLGFQRGQKAELGGDHDSAGNLPPVSNDPLWTGVPKQ